MLGLRAFSSPRFPPKQGTAKSGLPRKIIKGLPYSSNARDCIFALAFIRDQRRSNMFCVWFPSFDQTQIHSSKKAPRATPHCSKSWKTLAIKTQVYRMSTLAASWQVKASSSLVQVSSSSSAQRPSDALALIASGDCIYNFIKIRIYCKPPARKRVYQINSRWVDSLTFESAFVRHLVHTIVSFAITTDVL